MDPNDTASPEKLGIIFTDKTIKQNQLPWRFILSIILVILTTFQVLEALGPETSFAREQRHVFQNMIMGYSNDETNSTLQLYTISDIQWHFQVLFNTYKTLNRELFQSVDLRDAEFTLTAYSQSVNDIWYGIDYEEPIKTTLFLNETIPNIFSIPSDITQFFSGISFINITLSNVTAIVNQTVGPIPTNMVLCSIWSISTIYNVQLLTSIGVTMITGNTICGFEPISPGIDAYQQHDILFNTLVLLFAIISMIQNAAYMFRIGTLYRKAKTLYKLLKRESEKQKFVSKDIKALFIAERNSLLNHGAISANDINQFFEDQLDWVDLPMSEKLKFFDMWYIIRIFGNINQIISSISFLISRNKSDMSLIYNNNICMGLGCFFAWVEILVYFKSSNSITLISTTLRNSLTNSLILFGFALPIMIGFTLLSLSFFWKYNEFITFGWGSTTLFAKLCGDSLHHTFMNIYSEGYVKQFYLIIFIIIFYTGIQNIFVAIVMEGYEQSCLEKIQENDPFLTEPNKDKNNNNKENITENKEEAPAEEKKENIISDSKNKPPKINKVKNSTVDDSVIIDSDEKIENNSTLRKKPIPFRRLNSADFPSKNSKTLTFTESSRITFSPTPALNKIDELKDEDDENDESKNPSSIDNQDITDDKIKRSICLGQLFDITSKIKEEIRILWKLGQNTDWLIKDDDIEDHIKYQVKNELRKIEHTIQYMLKSKN